MKHAIAVPQQQPLFVDSRFAAAQSVANLLERGGRLVGSTFGQFSMIDLVTALLDRIGPAHVIMSSWRVALKDAEAVRGMLLDKRILSMELHLDRSFASCTPHFAASVMALFGEESIRISPMHAKVTLLRTDGPDPWFIAIRTTMNLNRNIRVESFDIDDHRQIHDYWRGALEEIRETMPPGLTHRAGDIYAALDRLRRGINVLSMPSRKQIRAAAPLDSPPLFQGWCNQQFALQKKKRRKAAAAIGVTLEELADIIETAEPQERAEDLAAWLLDATTIPVQGRTT